MKHSPFHPFIIADVLSAVKLAQPIEPLTLDRQERLVATAYEVWESLGIEPRFANQYSGSINRGLRCDRGKDAFVRQVLEANEAFSRTSACGNRDEWRYMLHELDEPSITLEQQLQFAYQVYATLGLKPSLIVYTGNKSLHFYLVFNKALDDKTYQSAFAAISDAWLVVSGVMPDQRFTSKAQTATFPGSYHSKSGRIAQLVGGTLLAIPTESLPQKPDFIYQATHANKRTKYQAGANTSKTEVLKKVYQEKRQELVELLGIPSPYTIEKALEHYAIDLQRPGAVVVGKGWESQLFDVVLSFGSRVQLELNSNEYKGIIELAMEHIESQRREPNDKDKSRVERAALEAMVTACDNLLEVLKTDLFALDHPGESHQYFSAFDLTKEGLIIGKSGTGTGKTQAMYNRIETIAKDNPGASMLIVSPRRQLINQCHAELQKRLGSVFLDYRDARGVFSEAPHLITSVDSLHKLGKATYDYIFVDELTLVLQTLFTSGTSIANTRLACKRVFRNLLLQCRQALLLSADTSNLEVETIRMLTNDSRPLTIYNNTHPLPDNLRKTIHLLPSEDLALAKIEELAKAGTKVFVACDSRGKAEAIERALKNNLPSLDLRLVTARTTSVQDVSELYKHQITITSPTLATGYDISDYTESIPSYFEAVVCLFTNNTSVIPASDLMQHVARVRYCPDVWCYVSALRYFRPKTLEDVIQEYRLGCNEATATFVSDVDGLLSSSSHDRECIKTQARYLQRAIVGSQLRRGRFLVALLNKGHILKTEEYKTAKATTLDLKLAREQLTEETYKRIAEAPDIDKETKELLETRLQNDFFRDAAELEQVQDKVQRYYIKESLRLEELAPTDVSFYYGTLSFSPTAEEAKDLPQHKGALLTRTLPEGKLVARAAKLQKKTRDAVQEEVLGVVSERDEIHGDLKQKMSLYEWDALAAIVPKLPLSYNKAEVEHLLPLFRTHAVGLKSLGVEEVNEGKNVCRALRQLHELLGRVVCERRQSKNRRTYTVATCESNPAIALIKRLQSSPLTDEERSAQHRAEQKAATRPFTAADDEEYDEYDCFGKPIDGF